MDGSTANSESARNSASGDGANKRRHHQQQEQEEESSSCARAKSDDNTNLSTEEEEELRWEEQQEEKLEDMKQGQAMEGKEEEAAAASAGRNNLLDELEGLGSTAAREYMNNSDNTNPSTEEQRCLEKQHEHLQEIEDERKLPAYDEVNDQEEENGEQDREQDDKEAFLDTILGDDGSIEDEKKLPYVKVDDDEEENTACSREHDREQQDDKEAFLETFLEDDVTTSGEEINTIHSSDGGEETLDRYVLRKTMPEGPGDALAVSSRSDETTDEGSINNNTMTRDEGTNGRGGANSRETFGSVVGPGAFRVASSAPGAPRVPVLEQPQLNRHDGTDTTAAAASASSSNTGNGVVNADAATTAQVELARDADVVFPSAYAVDDVEIGVVVEESKSKCSIPVPRSILLVGIVLLLGIIIIVSVLLTNNSHEEDSSEPEFPFTMCPSQKLVDNLGKQGDNFGYALDLSASGDTALIGAFKAKKDGIVEASGKAFIYALNENGDWYQEAAIYPADGQRGDHFGVKLALDAASGTAVISADQANGGAGAVHVFQRIRNSNNVTDWVHQTTLGPDDPIPGAQFGDSVAIRGDTIVVGAPFPSSLEEGVESVYIFVRNGISGIWEQQAKIVPNDGNNYSRRRFGRSVAISATANTLLVGADTDGDINGPHSGSAYIFSRQKRVNGTSPWTQEAKVAPEDGGSYQYFGFDVDVSQNGDTVIVSSWKDGELLVPATAEKDGITAQIGSAYVFTRSKSTDGSTWEQEAKLIANDGEENDRFGSSVAINDDASRILVGAYHDDERRGSAYLFHRVENTVDETEEATASWVQKIKLRADNVEIAEMYGYQVALDSTGERALISEHEDRNEAGRYSVGSVHLVDLDDSCLN